MIQHVFFFASIVKARTLLAIVASFDDLRQSSAGHPRRSGPSLAGFSPDWMLLFVLELHQAGG